MDENTIKKILVIDDEVYIRDSVIGFLEDFGFEVIDAENGKIGLEKFDSENPLLDARLPDGNRANATFPYVTPFGPSLTIRKFSIVQ